MSDLVKRARAAAESNRNARYEYEIDDCNELLDELASEIERLQARLQPYEEMAAANDRRNQWIAKREAEIDRRSISDWARNHLRGEASS
jgi:hypothetical protein